MKAANRDSAKPAPAWRQFWFWFVLAPPMASIVVGLSLLYTAVTQGDDKVVDNYYQAGRAIHKDFALERRAGELGLEASFVVGRADGQITVHLQGGDDTPERLKLYLSHATHARRDRRLELEADGTGLYRGHIGKPVIGRHYVRLEPMEGDWRLASALDVHEDHLEIHPTRDQNGDRRAPSHPDLRWNPEDI
ncbi:FixH family protein [Natronospira bacteriovora]|uniref:FixH family protein n=1 Tax=Natronospira bacteriovora TaxID=3069753 RepID=A0ABU0W929_9GAMM|nr:FixH family protein [Natronospira sp. AB-CW4]MDQ2070409.1 FixH family protein [Natronospira sp. AB-CW4]